MGLKPRKRPLLINHAVWVTRNQVSADSLEAGTFIVHQERPTLINGNWDSGANSEHWFDTPSDLEALGLPIPKPGGCWFVHIHTGCHQLVEGSDD